MTIGREWTRPLAEQIMAATVAAVTVSILLHGISVRPMMYLYRKRMARQGTRQGVRIRLAEADTRV